MPALQNVLLCAATALVLSTLVGLPLTRRLVANRALASVLAPIAGWAVFSTLALPFLTLVGFTRITVTLFCGAAAIVGGLLSMPTFRASAGRSGGSNAWPWGYLAATLVAVAPALGAWPKVSGSGIVLAEPMFDHSKVAIIDDIVRLGLPPGNPFFGAVAASPGLSYYYLWHFSAAVFDALLGTSGWEADIALTWFTAFASLALMMGLAVWLSGRRLAALLVLVLSLAASLRPILSLALPSKFLGLLFSRAEPPRAWIFQASWVPQHLASASCVVLAVLIMSRLGSPRSWFLVPFLAVIAAASFESSTWVGGLVFAVSAIPIGLVFLVGAEDARSRADFLAKSAAAAILAMVISFPFLRDEAVATAARHAGLPIALSPFNVLGAFAPEGLRRILDLPAYWAILLPVEFPAIYFSGLAALLGAFVCGRASADKRLVLGLAVLSGASFGVAWLFASTIANNDLGWRGVLPGICVLTIFAAAGLSRWLETAGVRALAAAACLVLGIPGGLAIVTENIVGLKVPSATAFTGAPELWAAVHRHTAPDERIASNPLLFADTVQWPINISWALFADRRLCFGGWNLARAFVALPTPDIDRLETLFDRVFAGDGSTRDLDELATGYDCRVVVLTVRDGAWSRDPFASDARFRLVDEETGEWRIYSIVGASPRGR
jgi:hypothetical protein